MKKNFTIGSDPEVMMTNNKNKIINAMRVIENDVFDTLKIEDYEFYHDNVVVEFKIPPANTKKEFLENIKKGLRLLKEKIYPNKILIKSSYVFPKKELYCEECFEINCSPQYSAYEFNSLKIDEKLFLENDLRTAGGHIHLGSNLLKNDNNKIILVYLLDIFLGCLSVFFENNIDELNRKKLYGDAGNFRVTDYGIEYRVLSNFWLKSPKLASFVYDACEICLNLLKSGDYKKFIILNKEEKEIEKRFFFNLYSKDVVTSTIKYSNFYNCIYMIKDLKEYLTKDMLDCLNANYLNEINKSLYKEWGI